jgi:hypothetical protein
MKLPVGLVVVLSMCKVVSGEAVPMKNYTVDLDLPPEKRWDSILQEYNSSVPLLMDYFNDEVDMQLVVSAMQPVFNPMQLCIVL